MANYLISIILLAVCQVAVLASGNLPTLFISTSAFSGCLILSISMSRSLWPSTRKELSCNFFLLPVMAQFLLSIELVVQIAAKLSSRKDLENSSKSSLGTFEPISVGDFLDFQIDTDVVIMLCLYLVLCTSILLKVARSPIPPFKFLHEIPTTIGTLISLSLNGCMNRQLSWIFAAISFFLVYLIFEGVWT